MRTIKIQSTNSYSQRNKNPIGEISSKLDIFEEQWCELENDTEECTQNPEQRKRNI